MASNVQDAIRNRIKSVGLILVSAKLKQHILHVKRGDGSRRERLRGYQ